MHSAIAVWCARLVFCASIWGSLCTYSFISCTDLSCAIRSICELIAFACFDRWPPTALKFLSLKSANKRSAEFKINCFLSSFRDSLVRSSALRKFSIGKLAVELLMPNISSMRPSYVSWVAKGVIKSMLLSINRIWSMQLVMFVLLSSLFLSSSLCSLLTRFHTCLAATPE